MRNSNTKLKAASFNSVAEFIRDGIESEYEDPANSVGYESAEGGYLLPTMDAWDIISEVGLDYSNDGFLEDLRETLWEHDWVRKDPYGLPEDEASNYSWEAFSDQVKYKTRFVFFKVASSTSSYPDPEPYTILENIGNIVTRLDLFQIIPKGTEIIRARQHSSTKSPNNAAELGVPPKEKAGQSRMSPAGIPMFYGAVDESTAFAEIFSAKITKPQITFARFKTLRPLLMLDLTSIQKVPSLFDSDAAHARMALSFMNSFESNATAPVPQDESLHYLYVPTQVVAEYFRHVFTLNEETKLDGIFFNSSKKSEGKCYTLFIDSTQCTDLADEPQKTLALLSCRQAIIDFTKQTYS